MPPTRVAAAHFTVDNTTGHDDRLLRVQTGAGARAELHTVGSGGAMTAATNGAVIPAHGTLALTTGKAHLMISELFGRLVPGQNVNIELEFRDAGAIDVVAPVVAVGQSPPTGPVRASVSSTPSGAHS